jgi:hypothetical protein
MKQKGTLWMVETTEQELLASKLTKEIGSEMVAKLERTVTNTLDQIDFTGSQDHPTGLVLGYVQSGKTTAMMALMAAAADRGYSIIIAFLGSTNLLLQQNSDRIVKKLGIHERNDYRWVSMINPKGTTASNEITGWLTKGRVIFIPVLKHSGRITDLATTLENVPRVANSRVLILDDEADQASLNTLVRSGSESRVYSAIDELRRVLPQHAFIQFTATPYAPLLLEADDPLFPRFVEFLEPGPGYTGGREFFIDRADMVVRYISSADEQTPKKLPIELPQSLESALWNFIIGSAVLNSTVRDSTPISMLIHPSPRKDVQERYHFLIIRKFALMSKEVVDAASFADLPKIARDEYSRLISSGVKRLDENDLLGDIKYVLSELKIWLLNSATAVKKVDWNVSPFHILVGGNKLERGFTVEGLTVTYMNRPSSDQVDTIEQRARAFGYRSEFLPFCQFFASARTIKMLRDIVLTEYDLRARLIDAVESGMTLNEWARVIGLLIPEGAKPTRDNVVLGLAEGQSGWQQIRKPSLELEAIESNWKLCDSVGLLSAALKDFGRLNLRELQISSQDAVAFLKEWSFGANVHSWSFNECVEQFERQAQFQQTVSIVLMEQESETSNPRPRLREWRDEIGFVNLFQGRDTRQEASKPFYPGDAYFEEIISQPSRLLIEIHRVIRKDFKDDSRLLTPAIYLGDRRLAKRKTDDE